MSSPNLDLPASNNSPLSGASSSPSNESTTSPAKQDPTEPGNTQASSSQPIPPVSLTPPKDKKKKVGFASAPTPPKHYAQPESSWTAPPEEDYFSHTPVDNRSAGNTPGVGDGDPGPASRRDSFDRDELTEALEKILKPEDHSGPQVAARLTLPRPALRKSVYPESPAEPVIGLSHPSEVEARHRAGRLAESVSGLVSRTSVDVDDESVAALLDGQSDARDYTWTPRENDTAAASGSAHEEGDPEVLTYRRRAQSDADNLVRKHTQRRAREQAMMSGIQTPDPRSGTSTPLGYDLEYAPPAPTKYLGGIMGSLLKLYSEERQGGSGTTTPDTRTPNRTPNRTPRSSPPSTTPGTPRVPDTPSAPPSRPRHGLFGLGSRHSASTLAELIGSSSTLVAPASSNSAGKDMSDHVSGNLKREREKKAHSRKASKSHAKAQQILVTKQ